MYDYDSCSVGLLPIQIDSRNEAVVRLSEYSLSKPHLKLERPMASLVSRAVLGP